MTKSGDLGPNPDETGFMVWCKNPSTSVRNPSQLTIQSCTVFNQIERDLPGATNSSFEAQHLTGLKVTSVDLIGPAAAPHSEDCLIDVETNIGIKVKLRYHLGPSGKVTVANPDE